MTQPETPPPSPEEKQNNTKLLNWMLILVGGLFVIAFIVLIYVWFTGRQPATPEPAPTLAPENGADPTWDRITAAGKMVVGTAADYPPFTFYNTSFQLDGFDIALMREIASRLNLQIEFQDIAFDGLYNAMLVNQIDLAAAGISQTAERAQLVDFSDVYYFADDAVLAADGSAVGNINTVNDLAVWRIGVERSTVYENWVQETLVDTGLIPQSNLLAYHQIESAVSDLVQGRVDVVLTDYNPATEFVAAGGVRIVGRGLNPQYFAIAMPKGAATLKKQVDGALSSIKSDGTMTQLYVTFLNGATGIIPPQVTPTSPPPAPTPTPPPCVDGMTFVADLTYPDNNMTSPPILLPGEAFIKGWRIRNSGTCTWNSGYVLNYVGGNTAASQMGGMPTPIVGQVPPGAVYDLYVQMTAPFVTGTYQGFWQLRNPAGMFFGSRIWAGIIVSVDGTIPGIDPPNIQRFQVNPDVINLGACQVADWNVQGNVQRVRLLVNNVEVWGSAPARGSYENCPPGAGQITYTVEATGQGGTSSRSRVATVNQAPPPQATATVPPPGTATAPPPTPTPPPLQPPVITSFVVQPATLEVGQCANMNWNVSGDAQYIRILRNGQVAFDNMPSEGNGQDCFSSRGSVSYVLEATGQGQTVNAQQNVTVNLVASFELVEIANSAMELSPVLPGTTITLDLNNDQVSGNAGCNTYTTSYTTNEDVLTVRPPSASQQTCNDPAGIMEQETQYLANLTQSNRYELAGTRLELIVRHIDPATRQEIDTILLVFRQTP